MPIGSKEAYTSAIGWSYFTNIAESNDISGLENTLTNTDVTISVENGNIVINGVINNENVEVYSMNGQRVYRGNATTIPVAVKGLYPEK